MDVLILRTSKRICWMRGRRRREIYNILLEPPFHISRQYQMDISYKPLPENFSFPNSGKADQMVWHQGKEKINIRI